jgi:plasmid stability protein
MATIIIRNLDEEVAARLKLQARQRGVSVEAEARRILAEGTQRTRAQIAADFAALRARQKPWKPGDPRGVDLIREDRDR